MKDRIETYFTEKLDIDRQIELLKEVVADDALKKEFARYQNTQALCSFSEEVIDVDDSKRSYRLLLAQKKREKRVHLIRKYAGYAAAIILLVVSVHLYHVYTYISDSPPIAETSLFVPAGQRVNLTLPDGTTVWLNAQSRLTYPTAFTGGERRVWIEGEAYFNVAPDKEMPFVVSTDEVDMKVLGTTFNVYNYPQEPVNRISLIEGSLVVYDSRGSSEGILLKPNEEVLVQNGEMMVSPIPNSDYFLWTEGIYSFENEELEVILKKLELYYDINIQVKDPDMLQWKYTVKFRQRDGIDVIIRLLQKIHPFCMHKEEEKNQIVIKK
ncbi:FecR domain-containing protein [Parabacteroides sp. OttesenSCG-928-O15]|nr:FecR domain-containing protein [Parabacteroides sp. OttesenSCG-928-O15]